MKYSFKILLIGYLENTNNIIIKVNVFLCQCMGDHWSCGWWSLSAEDFSSPEGAQTGALPPCPAQTAACPDEDHGQRGNILHATHALHLHI